jgi:hypothetical protein
MKRFSEFIEESSKPVPTALEQQAKARTKEAAKLRKKVRLEKARKKVQQTYQRYQLALKKQTAALRELGLSEEAIEYVSHRDFQLRLLHEEVIKARFELKDLVDL